MSLSYSLIRVNVRCLFSFIGESTSFVLFLQHVDERNFIHRVFSQKLLVAVLEDLLSIFDTNDLESLFEVADGDSLNAEHIVRVKDGLEVFQREERLLKDVDVFV